jgi:hypothetical protein
MPHSSSRYAEFAGQRLHEPSQLRAEEVEQRLGHELGHPAAAVDDRPLAGGEGAPVGSLAELQLRQGKKRPDGAIDEMVVEVFGIGVREHHDVAPRHRQAPPHGVALALRRAERREQLVLRVHLSAVAARDVAGAIGRVRVHQHDLVNQPAAVVQPGHLGQDRTDRLRDVARREHQCRGKPLPGVAGLGEACELLVTK